MVQLQNTLKERYAKRRIGSYHCIIQCLTDLFVLAIHSHRCTYVAIALRWTGSRLAILGSHYTIRILLP